MRAAVALARMRVAVVRPRVAVVRPRVAPARRWLVATSALAMLIAGCATTPSHAGTHARVNVVAAENFWGSIASQLGGAKVNVTSLIDNPATDPHDYEPTAADARAVATAQVVVVNGLGYDGWASKLLAANPATGRQTINVGELVGAGANANPHRWYNPSDVHQVVAAVSASLTKADPKDADYFETQRRAFEQTGLEQYDQLITDIKTKFAGTAVGASESIFAMLAPSLGLKVLTPATFLRATSEGTDPASSDKVTIDRQIKTHEIKVYIYNSQNATPDIRAQVAEAKAAGIPVTTITETLVPATATFQQWQTEQLQALEIALQKAAS